MAANDIVDANDLLPGAGAQPVSGLDPANPISTPLAAVRVPGSFSLSTVDDLDFLASGMGEVRNLLVKMLETDRSTGNFVQLNHKAHLEVECDFDKFVSFNGSAESDDDAYQFLGITLTNDPAVEPDANKRLTDSQYKLDLKPALAAGEGAPLSGASQKATYASDVLSSYWFPSGAVIIDLSSHASMSGLDAADRVVNIGSSAPVNGSAATYQVNADKTLIGMTLFAKVNVNCANTSGSPTLSADASFAPSSGVILGGGSHSAITIHLLNQEDHTKAQDVAIELQAGQTGELVGINVNQAAPGATEADDFDVTISIPSLGGEGDAGSIGKSMIDGIKASVNTCNPDGSNKLMEKFTIIVQQIDFETGSDFSGFMRTLATESTRDQALPVKEGEKFIVQTPATINLTIKPFEYAFYSTDYASNVASFKLIDAMEVYAVLKHKNGSAGRVLQSSNKALL